MPGGYWLMPSLIACLAASRTSAGPSSSGNPCPRLIAPVDVASADISAKIVGANSPFGPSNPAPRAVRSQAPETLIVWPTSSSSSPFYPIDGARRAPPFGASMLRVALSHGFFLVSLRRAARHVRPQDDR